MKTLPPRGQSRILPTKLIASILIAWLILLKPLVFAKNLRPRREQEIPSDRKGRKLRGEWFFDPILPSIPFCIKT